MTRATEHAFTAPRTPFPPGIQASAFLRRIRWQESAEPWVEGEEEIEEVGAGDE